MVYTENIAKFWSTFLLGAITSALGYFRIIRRREPHGLRYLDLIVIAKRKLWQRVLRLSIEVRVHRKQLFRRDLGQLPRFEFALNPTQYVSKKLDFLPGREMVFVVHRLKLYRPEIVDLLFELPPPNLPR